MHRSLKQIQLSLSLPYSCLWKSLNYFFRLLFLLFILNCKHTYTCIFLNNQIHWMAWYYDIKRKMILPFSIYSFPSFIQYNCVIIICCNQLFSYWWSNFPFLSIFCYIRRGAAKPGESRLWLGPTGQKPERGPFALGILPRQLTSYCRSFKSPVAFLP